MVVGVVCFLMAAANLTLTGLRVSGGVAWASSVIALKTPVESAVATKKGATIYFSPDSSSDVWGTVSKNGWVMVSGYTDDGWLEISDWDDNDGDANG